ncbi:L-threonylcarbamoyladenylate synthase [Staphylococcus simulans]|uniref:L-threonylcarbamoyladenylate synthase n=1 Tax=Staphylococcus simulans TaxID=1286 RepID=UPI0021D26E17|nr:L-threonylcarbamoyladenylate synthase [Staphylococcus simulans]UXR50786.1 L-threonylcarbamoyladenylate synthase [Staphylococcus simulans]
MMTKTWDLRNQLQTEQGQRALNEISDIYHAGGLVAIPTETVYGLGANACDDQAVRRIYEAKGRPSDNPLIIHIHDKSQLNDFVASYSKEVGQLMDAFWPGPISFILPLKPGYLCERVSGGLDSIAVRMPSHPIGRAILKYTNLPIAAPSANISGRPSPTTFSHVFNDMDGRVEGIVNGDQSEEGLESTVLDCTQYPYRIARPGAITEEMIDSVLPGSVDHDAQLNTEKPIAPGMKYKHYSPQTPVAMLTSLTQAISEDKDWSHTLFAVPATLQAYLPKDAIYRELAKDVTDLKSANHMLYQILHELDTDESIEQGYIYRFEPTDESTAFLNRLEKATGNQQIGADQL